MEQEEAKTWIMVKWKRWDKKSTPASRDDMFAFFRWLSVNRTDLLNFRCHGDKWEHVHGWLRQHEDAR